MSSNLVEMKALALWIFVLSFISFSLADTETIKNAVKNTVSLNDKNNIETCKAETGMTDDERFSDEDVANEEYKKPENEERRRRVACTILCTFRKEGLMVNSDIKENKFHEEINKHTNEDGPIGIKLHKMFHKCIKEANHETEGCDKAFALFVCVTKNIRKIEETQREYSAIQSNESAQE